MNVNIVNVNHSITDLNISTFEKEFGLSLPEEYKNFLLTYNGGKPKPRSFDYKLKDGRSWSGGIRDFFGLGLDDWEDLRFYYSLYKDRIPKQMLPVGNDDGGNLVLLGLTHSMKGNVYFWDHNEESDDENLPTYDNIYFIANNFKEFLSNLREE